MGRILTNMINICTENSAESKALDLENNLKQAADAIADILLTFALCHLRPLVRVAARDWSIALAELLGLSIFGQTLHY